MTWLCLALLAPLLWAASNLIDGRLIRERFLSPLALCGVTGLFGFLPGALLLATGQLHWPSVSVAAVGVLVGGLSILSYYPYFKALESVHPVSAVLLWNTAPVLVAALAFGFLGERLAVPDYAAGAFLVASAALISIPARGVAGSGSAVGWMMLASLSVAVESVLQKWLFMHATPDTVLFLTYSSGAFLSAALFTVSGGMRRELRSVGAQRGRALVVSNEVLNLVAGIAASLAVNFGPVSLVKAVGGLQPLFVLGLAVIIGRLRGTAWRSLPGRPRPWVALSASLLAIAGLFLLSSA